MTLPSGGYEVTRRAISAAYQRAIDAHTVEEAVRYHSELVDLLSVEAMIVRTGTQYETAKRWAIDEINARAAYHRDVVDRLTDVIEGNRQLICPP